MVKKLKQVIRDSVFAVKMYGRGSPRLMFINWVMWILLLLHPIISLIVLGVVIDNLVYAQTQELVRSVVVYIILLLAGPLLSVWKALLQGILIDRADMNATQLIMDSLKDIYTVDIYELSEFHDSMNGYCAR